jgi:hypothetical protein
MPSARKLVGSIASDQNVSNGTRSSIGVKESLHRNDERSLYEY